MNRLRHSIHSASFALIFSAVSLEYFSLMGIAALLLFFDSFFYRFSNLLTQCLKWSFEFLLLFYMLAFAFVSEADRNLIIICYYIVGLFVGITMPPFKNLFKSDIFLTIILTLLIHFFVFSYPEFFRTFLLGFGYEKVEYNYDFRETLIAISLVYLLCSFSNIHKLSIFLSKTFLIGLNLIVLNKFAALSLMLMFFNSFFVFILALLSILIGWHSGFLDSRVMLIEDFFNNVSTCGIWGCSYQILNITRERVQSFHNLFLDFYWYGGIVGLFLAIFIFYKILLQRNAQEFFKLRFLFMLGMVLGLPPFYGERHLLLLYGLLKRNEKNSFYNS